jgi:PTH1 family peptidyl-tRNA hydrolase
MKSVIYHLKKDDFTRIRIGIGRPPEGWDLADYVLSRFKPEEKIEIERCIKLAADSVEIIISSGVDIAMNTTMT